MRFAEYLCLGGTELANYNRTATYVTDRGISGLTLSTSCNCPAMEDDYITFTNPIADDAPWYDSNVPESADFLGLLAYDIQVLPVIGRDSNVRAGRGSILSRIGYGQRIIQVRAYMFAANSQGMQYGVRWLNQALMGSYCLDGCAPDVLTLLPACPEDLTGEDAEPYFREVYNVGIVDGPNTAPVGDLPECHIQQVSFQLAGGIPFLFSPPEVVLEDYPLDGYVGGSEVCTMVSTNGWPGDGAAIIKIEAEDDDLLGIHLYAKPSLDGECPAVEGMPCWEVYVDHLPKGHVLTFDAVREDVYVYNPSSKREEAGLPYIRLPGTAFITGLGVGGLYRHLEIPPCTDMCICVELTPLTPQDGTLLVTVEQYNREV